MRGKTDYGIMIMAEKVNRKYKGHSTGVV